MRYPNATLLIHKKDIRTGVITTLYEFVIQHRSAAFNTLFEEVMHCVAGRLTSGRVYDNTSPTDSPAPRDYVINIEVNSDGNGLYGAGGDVEEMVNHVHERLGWGQ